MIKLNTKHSGLFAAGVVFGTAGIKVLSSKDAKKLYTNCTAAALRAKDCVMKTVSKVQENAEDIYAEAKQINEDRAAAEEIFEDAAEEETVEETEETAEETAQRIALANQAQTALTRLLAKEEIVINYFKNVWNVQFYDDAMGNKGLVSLVQDAINQIVNENTPE